MGLLEAQVLAKLNFLGEQHQTQIFTISDQLTCAFFTDLDTNLDELGTLALSWSDPPQEAPLAPAGSRWLPKPPGIPVVQTRQAGDAPGRAVAPPAAPPCPSSARGGLPASRAVPGREEPKASRRLPFPRGSLSERERGWDTRALGGAPPPALPRRARSERFALSPSGPRRGP